MKKIIALLLLLALTAGFAVSCKNDDVDALPPETDTDGGNTDTGTNGGDTTPDTDDKDTNKIDTSGLEGVDMFEDDLADYVEIDEKYYKGYTVLLDPDRVSTFDIENQIIKVLCKNKSKEPVEADGIISVGDVVDMYYRGYYIDEGGEKVYFDGGCNFVSMTPHSLEIGSGGFIPGFEYNLIGRDPAAFATVNILNEGSALPGDIIVITYSVMRADGTSENSKRAVVDLSDPKLDETFGGGFAEYLKSSELSVKSVLQEFAVSSIKVEGGVDLYKNVTIEGICRVDKTQSETVLVVEAYFPDNYGIEALDGKTAYFEIYTVKNTEYSAPELDDAFITDTLKLADQLADYEGETLAEKYRAYLREAYMLENGLDEDTLIIDAFWESVLEGAVLKKYPEKQVAELYNLFIDELEYYYKSYSLYYKFEDFVCLYIGLEVGADWRAELRTMAQSQIKQQLIFYRIMHKEGLKPTEEEYNAIFDEYLTSALKQSSITPDKFETEEEYLAKKEEYKRQLIEANGEDYFKNMIYYEVTVEALKSYANVVETSDK